MKIIVKALKALFATATVPPLMAVVGAATVVATYVIVPLPVTLPPERDQPEHRVSRVYALDGTEIGIFKGADTQLSVGSEDIPDTIRRAVLAAEDHRFYEHEGIDWKAISRAAMADVKAGKIVQGGSTITQQLVKSLYTGAERSAGRKVREAVFAIRLERNLSKDEILARYLNTVYLGDSVFGVEAAAQSYYRKRARDLTLSEAAMLAGVIPAPSRYSPRTHKEIAEQRRNQVLDQILQYRMGTPEEVAAARAEIPVIHPPLSIESRYPYFMDYLRVYLLHVKNYPPEMIYEGGLKIETTLDPRLQDAAQKAMTRLDRPKDPEAAMVSLEPQTGFVRAIVGGRDWAKSQVNLALGRLGGGSGRQAGSSFKTFVLAKAFEAGIGPDKKYRAPSSIRPKGFDKPVGNYGGSSYGTVDLRKATWNSINTVFVQLIVDTGVREAAEMAQRLGISSVNLEEKLYGVLAIGTHETSPLEMSSAYGVFANRGVKVDPTPVVRITDRTGKVIEDNSVPSGRRLLDESVADNVNSVLEGVLTKGTARRALLTHGCAKNQKPAPPPNPNVKRKTTKTTVPSTCVFRPAAGKTGTSQNWENAWFVGYTPTLSTAVWMGHPNANISMANVHGFGHVTGGSLPAMIWQEFMTTALEPVPPLPFVAAGPLRSVAEREAKERRALDKHLDEREGLGIPLAKTRGELPPEEAWRYTPVPLPVAKAPPQPARSQPDSEQPAAEGPIPEDEPQTSGPPTTSKPPPKSTPTTQPPKEDEPPLIKLPGV